MALDFETGLRQRLRRAGYSPIPVEGKRPAPKAWEQKVDCSLDEIRLWGNVYNLASNTGILTRLTPTLDIDILNPAAAVAVEDLARERFEERGFFLVRVGEAPKRAILLRTDEPFSKITGDVIAPDESAQKIELLCNGQQVVVFGIHPKTLAPYRWHGGEPGEIAWQDLPYITAQEAAAFVADAVQMLVAEYGYKQPPPRPTTAPGERGDSRGSADWSWLIGNIREGKDLHDSSTMLAAKLISAGMHDGAAVNMLRGVFENSLLRDQRWQERYDDIPRDVESARRKFGDEAQQTNGHDKQPASDPPALPTATPYIFPDPAMIPRREWLYAGHYVRGAVTATVAPGGFGKTTLTLYEAIAMAQQGLRVWYISGEDPKVEIDRRIAAHCQHHNVDGAAIAPFLFVDDKASFPLFLGTSARASAVKFDEAWFAHLEREIREKHIDVTVIDPFISFHTVSESDNGAIDQIVKRLGLVTQVTASGMEISHHVRKSVQGFQAELTVDDTRGGSAIVNAVRCCRVFNRMSANEAGLAKIGQDKRTAYIRIDKGKRNMAPAEKAGWWRIVSVPLPNGDNVQAIEPYQFPSAFEGMSGAEIDWVQAFLRDGGPRRASSQSDDWLGHHLGLHCGREDTHEKGGAIWANKIISQWLANKVFRRIKMRDPETRKPGIAFYADKDFVVPTEDEELPLPRKRR